jgi:hypothetical protein
MEVSLDKFKVSLHKGRIHVRYGTFSESGSGSSIKLIPKNRVVNPDPNPSVFGHPGSGSGSFIIKQK